MEWFLVILFAVFSAVLLSGRGAFLIAGYNTAGKARKMRYNEKKLCRVVGGEMGFITLLLAVLAMYKDTPPKWLTHMFPAAVALSVVIMIILGNTICRNKDAVPVAKTEEERKANEKIAKASWIFCAVVFLIAGILLVVGDIKITVNQENIEIDGFFWSDYAVNIRDVESVSLTDDLNTGRRTNGFGSFKLLQGNFENNRFGNYILYAYTKCKSYVVLETSKGVVVINAETEEETKALYEKIKEK